ITSTPAIRLTKETAPKEGIIFVVAKSKATNGKHLYKLFALSLENGQKIGEITIEGSVKGSGFGSTGSGANRKITFDAAIQLNRPALLLQDNVLYVAFGGHCDRPREPNRSYHGWIFAYSVANPKVLKKLDVFCTTP